MKKGSKNIYLTIRTPSKSSNLPKAKTLKEKAVKKNSEEKLENKEDNLTTQTNEKASNQTQETISFNPNLPRKVLAQRGNPSKSSSSKKKSTPTTTKKEARKWNDIDTNISSQDIDKYDEYYLLKLDQKINMNNTKVVVRKL